MADETTPPLDDARLEQMRGYAEAIRTAKHAIESVSSELVVASDYMLTLIAEVDRLHAENALLTDENNRLEAHIHVLGERAADMAERLRAAQKITPTMPDLPAE